MLTTLTFLLCSQVIQRPGDVLYVLPHAIHWGINLGLNINEGINIASASWAKSGLIAPTRCPCLRYMHHVVFINL